jgi:hypothetical protein
MTITIEITPTPEADGWDLEIDGVRRVLRNASSKLVFDAIRAHVEQSVERYAELLDLASSGVHVSPVGAP